MLELMLDERRTFTVEPVAYLERFMSVAGPSPISASVGGFETPKEVRRGEERRLERSDSKSITAFLYD